MSSITLDLVALAHYKLRLANTGGMKDNLSLRRLVLLRNSITAHDRQSDLTVQNAASQADAAETSSEVDIDLEDEVDSNLDCDKFMFPDPGDDGGAHSDLTTQNAASRADAADSSSEVDTAFEDEVNSRLDSVKYTFPDPEDDVGTPEMSEEQWLDSLLENLGDEDSEDEDDARISPVRTDDTTAKQLNIHPRADIESLRTSLSDELAMPDPITVPHPEPYPPLTYPFEHDSHDCCSASDMEDSEGSVPDAIEDTSDNESESIATPFSRSRVSLSLVDPASITLPQDQNEAHIYDSSNVFYPHGEDPFTHSDAHSSSAPIHSPYHQGC
ncbi:uncharacterized protein FOMMEDRAFT_156012 [Fomitiporia mediterranea MF3/22]|uniref:uncharacterized protein n=1 Tax=Fomitiporia mediterranea (strain MF3/22) TaxID=694068 RepID=UPI000440885B|nr:uncharacterized protein FOMMEDRAFT_156012 [Fomitiporia mediterranea MF3/22]EJD02682.1 hypothetical protein FOMMEDRAFT_156012 [Fomitiporia mediterranea MF3/22]